MPDIISKRTMAHPGIRHPSASGLRTGARALLLVLCGSVLALAIQGPALAREGSANSSGRVPRLWEHLDARDVRLESKGVLIVDEFGNELYAKDADTPRPLASITKLMTAMVVLDRRQNLNEVLTITREDRDLSVGSRSRLTTGTSLSREELLQLALMSSENRATATLARNYPGGSGHFVKMMNLKARTLGLRNTHFSDPTGLSAENTSTPRDLARLVRAAQRYPLIRSATTAGRADVRTRSGGSLSYVNTNPLVRNGEKHWQIGISKTGYIGRAGRCLVMQADIDGQVVVMVLMNSNDKLAPVRDANRVRRWLERGISDARLGQIGQDKPDGA